MKLRNRKTVKLNKERLRDKIYAAWIGKNIGGTIGAPYEGQNKLFDIKGFASEPGKPLPNDDLDLQLMWLFAMEQEGPWYFGARTLSEYWLLGIDPCWNEYGRGMANLCDGVVAPLSGELHNEKWRHSNGAWIRSEIWACLCPGFPSIAREYAFADACIDHGMGEGTYAELFTATLESKAFFMNDVRKLIEEGLAAIPSDCRVYKAVKLVLDEYDKGTPYPKVREMLIKQSEDIGVFQAPANLGYVTIGLLYGEGDFKNSVLYAVNCGDDTDCTGATVGAILGIVNGTRGIPEDWAKHIGDEINFICINTMYRNYIPKTCEELTERVMRLLPIVFYSHRMDIEWTDGDDELPDYVKGVHAKALSERSRWCFELPHLPYVYGHGEYDRCPVVKPGEQIKLRLKLNGGGGSYGLAYHGNGAFATYNMKVSLKLPEGWTAEYSKVFCLALDDFEKISTWEATVTVGENVEAINHVYAIAESNTHNQPLIADFVIEG